MLSNCSSGWLTCNVGCSRQSLMKLTPVNGVNVCKLVCIRDGRFYHSLQLLLGYLSSYSSSYHSFVISVRCTAVSISHEHYVTFLQQRSRFVRCINFTEFIVKSYSQRSCVVCILCFMYYMFHHCDIFCSVCRQNCLKSLLSFK